MKIIDLLNKIANGEEVPDAIKFNDIIYKKADVGEDYYSFTIHKWFFKDVFDASGVNIEVEILEEEKKIPEKLDVISWDKCIHGVTHKEKELAIEINKTQELLNQVIDYLKSKGE